MRIEDLNKFDKDYLFEIEKKFSVPDDFSIKGKLEFVSDGFMEIGNMFVDKQEMEEAGITQGSRTVTAFNKDGYNQLREMGFSHKEIIRAYGYDKGDKSTG